MKKTAAFLMALLLLAGCLFMLAGCGKRYTAADLSAYLDEEGFVAGMSQQSFIEKVEKIEGEKVGVLQWDGEHGGGCEINSTNGSYSNGYVADEDEGEAVYYNTYNTLSMTANLKGLKLPAGIRFSDTLADVLKKLSVEGDPVNEFTPDPGETDLMTLYAEGNVTLRLARVGIALRLEFIERSARTMDDGRIDAVTRKVGFSFADGNGTLKNYSISVTERYPLTQSSAE